MYMGKGYGFQPEAGVALASEMFGMPNDTHFGFLPEEALSGFAVSDTDNAVVSMQVPTKSKSLRFVVSMGLLHEFLDAVRKDYAVFPFGPDLTALNSMVYYDVPGFRLFRDHMNGKAARCQVKLKDAQGNQSPKFEVKFRSNKGVTEKHFLAFDKDFNPLFTGEVADKFHQLTGVAVTDLSPALSSGSDKFILLNSDHLERIEVDAGLRFALPGSREDGLVIPLAVVRISGIPEIGSEATRFFQRRSIRTLSFSRYMLGGSFLLKGQKSNRYKNKIRQIQKIVQYEPAC
ncbi:MAG TPA: hypothetical protein DCY35_05415 [Prolixibacteraceae bacterium]|nr:hypothetical protein [Prolixibacteraceae bacterium]